jgi:hypothetical protein
MLLRRAMLPFYGVMTSLLPLLHLPVTLHHIASPIEPKPKHSIRTAAIGRPP